MIITPAFDAHKVKSCVIDFAIVKLCPGASVIPYVRLPLVPFLLIMSMMSLSKLAARGVPVGPRVWRIN